MARNNQDTTLKELLPMGKDDEKGYKEMSTPLRDSPSLKEKAGG